MGDRKYEKNSLWSRLRAPQRLHAKPDSSVSDANPATIIIAKPMDHSCCMMRAPLGLDSGADRLAFLDQVEKHLFQRLPGRAEIGKAPLRQNLATGDHHSPGAGLFHF